MASSVSAISPFTDSLWMKKMKVPNIHLARALCSDTPFVDENAFGAPEFQSGTQQPRRTQRLWNQVTPASGIEDDNGLSPEWFKGPLCKPCAHVLSFVVCPLLLIFQWAGNVLSVRGFQGFNFWPLAS